MTQSELTDLLRAARPAAPPALAARVAELVSATQSPRGTLLDRVRVPRVRLALVPAVAALALVAGALVTGALRSGGSLDSGVVADTTRAVNGAAEKAPTPSTSTDASPPITLPGPSGRPERYQAELSLKVEDTSELSTAARRALEITRSLGGYVVSSVVNASGDEGTASLTLRVPSARAQEAVVRLSSLGEIVSQSVSIDDLQAPLDTLARRQAALTAEIGQLVRELAKPGLTADERIALRARLTQARAELQDVVAQRAQTAEEARYATFFVSLSTRGIAAVPEQQSRLERTVRNAGSALEQELAALLYALIVVSPLLLATGVAVWWLRHRRRREEDDVLERP